MGRRAADLTTPVPVLGIPALVGARSWRTTGGDTTAGAQLQTWGLQSSSVGIQTSPGVARAPSERCAQLMYKLHTQSLHNTHATNSDVTKEYKALLLLTNSDKEKGANSEKLKSKKEVTFQEFVGETLGDVVCSKDHSDSTPRTIKANPHSAGTVTNAGPRIKPAVRYTNGSVVDSEAMGGISVDNGDVTPTRGGYQKRPRSYYAEQSRDMLLFSAPARFSASQKICNQCGGRRAAGVEIFGKNILTAPACQSESLFNSDHDLLHSSKHLQLRHNETDSQPSNRQLPENYPNRKKETSPQQGSPLQEALRHKKTRHPARPVHSIKGHFLTHKHAATLTEPQTIHTNAITITDATIETKKDDRFDSLTNMTLGNKTAQTGSLPSTPLMATATKSNYPPTQTHSKCQYDVLQKVCVSVHATQENPPSHLCTTSNVNSSGIIPKTVPTFNSTLMSAKGTPANTARPRGENPSQNSTHSAQRRKTKDDSKVSPKYLIRFSDHLKSQTQPTPVNPGHTSVDVAPTLREKTSLYSTVVVTRPVKHNVNLKANSNASDKHNKTQPVSSNTASLNASCATLDSKLETSAPISTTPNYALYRNRALRSYSNIHPSSTLKENQKNLSVSYNSSLKTSNVSRKHNKSINHNTFPCRNKPCHTQTTDITSEHTHQPALFCFVPNPTATLGLSKVAKYPSKSSHASNVIQSHPNRTDNSNKLNSELYSDEQLLTRDLINDLLWNESQKHSVISQDATPQNSICPIKSNDSRLQGCTNARQQTGAHYQGSTVREHEGQCATCPAGRTARRMDSNTQDSASGISTMHASSKTESNAHKQTHPNDPTASVAAKGKCEPIITPPTKRNVHYELMHMQRLESNKSQVQQTLRGSKLPLIAPELCCGEGEHYTRCNSASPQRLGSREAEAIISRDSKVAGEQDTAELVSAHSHPTDVVLFLPSSPRCGESAAIQQRLASVEASLAANKDRINTLLNIIHDLEASHTPATGRRCDKTGQDLKSCSTCQKNACIVYSVEYDFRQQERRFLEVLNVHSSRGKHANRLPQSCALNFSLLRKAMKNVTSKKRSKKLCKILLKWLPRKLKQV
ncbi:uncharacterized protein LOC133416116 [Phycodurus eques]|uniref:uncharacterized protein LOC133416116 n=1 Tax=Phycodurus eques TaxID=693459 RepID=UPI002ACE495F|nr:uncharacterized protein LOC133416116 [Phycodurus eques]XP_061558763.1 uncharacterized protein LOC133416116 [Phycodurus eques]